MASIQQHTPISLQSKTPQIPRCSLLPKPSNLSFSASFSSLNLSFATRRSLRSVGRGGGIRMSATAAGCYASALADFAKSNDTLDTTCADVEKLEKIFGQPEVAEFFMHPSIEDEKKRKVIEETAASAGLLPHTVNFLYILLEAQRMDIINDVVKEFEVAYNKMTDTELAVVTSVVKLESQHLAQIAKQVQKLTGKKNVRIKSVIDPSLVAGFTIRYGDGGSKLIDMSVKKQLEDIASQIEIDDIELAV